MGVYISGGGGLGALITGIALIAIAAPTGRKWLYEKTRIRIHVGILAVICVALLWWQLDFANAGYTKADQEAKAKLEQESANRIAKAKADNKAEFDANKSSILADITSKIRAGQLPEAQAITSKFLAATSDPDLARLKHQIDLEQTRARLSGLDKEPLETQVNVYTKLASLEPSNRDYAEKAKLLSARLDRIQAEKAAEAQRQAAQALRKADIERQFSAWSGAHINLERAVKQSMKNPDSYQHVETRYRDMGDTIIVTTTIRGTNSFGGVVPQTFVAEVDRYGNVMSLRSAN